MIEEYIHSRINILNENMFHFPVALKKYVNFGKRIPKLGTKPFEKKPDITYTRIRN